ncbi:MAG: patatin-like phospholipase family protein [Anaerolineales bacterium]
MKAATKRALVLSGGGGRGAYHVGALTYLQNVDWHPDIIIGTSVGALNAATLGSGIPVSGLRDRWLDLETADIQKMRADDVFIDNMVRGGKHIFDTTPFLKTALGRNEKWSGRPWIIPEILNGPHAPYEVWITAVDLEERALVYFTNRGEEEIPPEAVRASFSIPLWYEPTIIDHRPHVDGGTLANTPFRKALELGATEVVVVVLTPWPGRPARTWKTSRLPWIDDELLAIPQRLWTAFEPALDMMLTEMAWRDYLLFERERRAGEHAQLDWLRVVSPEVPPPVGLMTNYLRDNHIRLYRRGEKDARALLHDLLGRGSRASAKEVRGPR